MGHVGGGVWRWNRSGVWGVVCWEVGVGGGAWCVGGGGVCVRGEEMRGST